MSVACVELNGSIVLNNGTTVTRAWLTDELTTGAPAGNPTQTLTGFFFPGLVDAHCHIGLDAQGATSDHAARQQAHATWHSGVTLVRDAGSPRDTRFLDGEPNTPSIIRAGRHIARPRRYIRHFAWELDDPQQLPAAIEAQAKAGDGWVKIVADWIDRSTGQLAPLWTRRQLVEGIARAHDLGARVTAHTFSTAALDDLFDAGIDGIEHGTGMTADHMARAADAAIPVTPTLLQVGRFSHIADQGHRYPLFARQMRAMGERRYDHVAHMVEAGVKLLVGTDAGGTIEHGRIADECAELVAAGVPAPRVMDAATWQARAFLAAAPRAARLPAAVVGYENDPRRDITELHRPRHIVAPWRG